MLAGPYEFLADNPFLYGAHAVGEAINSMPGKAEAQQALAAHRLLKVDAGWLSPKAERWMRDRAGGIPTSYAKVGVDPVARILQTPAGAVGIVFFPEGKAPGKAPAPEVEQKVLAAGRALREKTVLVLGVSPWGYVGERDFLPKAEGVFSCILGGGEGVSLEHVVPEKHPGILWVRPDGQGRAVNMLELLQLPAPGTTPQWREGVTFNASLEFLDSYYTPDPAMRTIVGEPKPNND